MKLTHYGKVENGAVKFNNRKLFDKDLSQFDGKDIEITIERRKKRRTSQQNRFYWGVIIPLVWRGLRDNGYDISDAEETHTILKTMFNKGTFEDKETGEEITYGKSTTEMTTSEMQDYWADIMQFAAMSLNVIIPDPNEVYGDEFVKQDRKKAA
jgi:hypothetical protein